MRKKVGRNNDDGIMRKKGERNNDKKVSVFSFQIRTFIIDFITLIFSKVKTYLVESMTHKINSLSEVSEHSVTVSSVYVCNR